ncbi:MAG TPA: MFS transporter [Candidatus Dormibacteraeota bacterium]|nr:MFS transporter [Candidatus Dormibacteraeota bacterium]
MATADHTRPDSRGVFAQRDFRTLWLAQFVSVFGDFLALFGVVSLITFRWHGTATQVTYLLIAYMLPLAVVSPISGVFVDRWRVKQVMVFSDLIRGVLVLLLLWVTDLAQLCAIFVALSVVSSFFAPAQSVVLHTLVTKEKLLAANALMSQAFYAVRLLSPVVAGALVAWLTEKSCFYLDAFSFFFSAAMVGSLLIKRDAAPVSNTVKGFLEQLTSGNRFIFTHPSLAFVITSMVSAMFVMSCLSPLFSIYVRDILHSGVFMYGVVSSAVGVGLIVGTATVNRFGRDRSKKSIVLSGLVACAAGVALLGIFRAVSAAVATTFTMGFGISFVVVAAQTLMQQETPPSMLGRVSSSFMSVFSLAQVLGLLLSGHLAVWFGIRAVFLLCAAALTLIATVGLVHHKPKEISAVANAD